MNIYENLSSIYQKTKKNKSFLIVFLIFFTAFLTIGLMIIFLGFILYKGLSNLSLDLFLINSPNSILPELINTLYVEIVSLIVAIPVGISTAIWLTQFGKPRFLADLIDFSTKILASVPSILFGLFGHSLFCVFFGLKNSIMAGSLTMAVCVLPIFVQTTKEAILNVPKNFQAGALALGASKTKTIFSIVLPCSISGILTAIILAAGKIIGESAALVLTVGSGTKFPQNIFGHVLSSGRTLSLHLFFIAGNSSKANSINVCFATATVLLGLTLILNFCATILTSKFAKL